MFPIRLAIPAAPGSWGLPVMVAALIAANLLIFLYQMLLPDRQAMDLIISYGVIPLRYSDPDFAGGWGRTLLPLLASQFLHGGLLHVAINMWTLWLFGPPLERRLGAGPFLIFYLLCGIAASATHILINPGSSLPMIGASGAIAGVLGGVTLLHPRAGVIVLVPILLFPVTFTLPAMVYTGLWFLVDLSLGLGELWNAGDGGGVARWAHVGGLVTGAAFGLFLRKGRGWRQPRLIGSDREQSREIGPARRQAVHLALPRRAAGMPSSPPPKEPPPRKRKGPWG